MKWLVCAKAWLIDFPRGLYCAVVLLTSGFALALGHWWRVYGFCLPGDEIFCVNKLLLSAFNSVVGAEVPFDYAASGAQDPGFVRTLSASAVALALTSLLLRNKQRNLSAWLLSYSKHAKTAVISDQLAPALPADDSAWVYLLSPSADAAVPTCPAERRPCSRPGDYGYVGIKRRLLRRSTQLLLYTADAENNLRDLDVALDGPQGRDNRDRRELAVRADNFWRRRQIHDELRQRRYKRRDIASIRCESAHAAVLRSLLAEYPPNFVIDAGDAARIAVYWVIGIADLSLELLLAAARLSPTRFHAAARYRTFGSHAQRAAHDMNRAAPALSSVISVLAQDRPVAFPDVAEDIVAQWAAADDPCTLYLCFDNDELAAAWRTAFSIAFRRRGQTPPLILSVPASHASSAGDDPDVAARRAHELFRHSAAGRLSTTASLEWQDLSFDLQEENRSLVNHALVKARDGFCQLLPLTTTRASHIDSGRPVVTEASARTEHLRWRISHAVLGWSPGTARDDNAHRHPSMIEWDELPGAERAKDMAAAGEYAGLVNAQGLALQPMKVLVLSASPASLGDKAGDFAIRVKKTIAAVGENYRTALLLIEIASTEMTIAIQLLGADHAMGVILSDDLQPALLPPESMLAPERLQQRMAKIWCIIRLHGIDAKTFARSMEFEHVEI